MSHSSCLNTVLLYFWTVLSFLYQELRWRAFQNYVSSRISSQTVWGFRKSENSLRIIKLFFIIIPSDNLMSCVTVETLGTPEFGKSWLTLQKESWCTSQSNCKKLPIYLNQVNTIRAHYVHLGHNGKVTL